MKLLPSAPYLKAFRLPLITLLLCLSQTGCKNEPSGEIKFGTMGSLSQPSGKNHFRFGAATAAAQIEEGLTANDWYHWTLPEEDGGLGKSPFVGDASMAVANAAKDIQLLTDMNLDAYRFSVEWARIEPQRNQISQEGLDHYDTFLDGLAAASIRPMVTIHHFSNPIWTYDFREPDCEAGATPTDTNLCGWAHDKGADLIIEELAEHAALLAREYGDRVDEWCTLNEPINYLIASYGVGQFPPGVSYLLGDFDQLMVTFRNYIRAHVAIYDAIKANDTIDADGDGRAADIGFSLSVIDWQPAQDNQPSDDPYDIEATKRIWYVYHHLFPDALIHGGFDVDLDQIREEEHPQWKNKLDWLGLQYYSRNGVSASPAMIPGVDATICAGGFDFGSCLPPVDETHMVPSMGYEYYEKGIYNVIMDMKKRYPTVPFVITEAGIATKVGKRRAENTIRTLEQVHRAMDDGADVRGYYHWSLMDNFEWSEGYEPQFGLYTVDRETYDRTPTEGATVLGELSKARKITEAQREEYGGTGPMTPEEE